MSKSKTATDVMLFYPNLVGYLRIVFMIGAFYTAKKSWEISSICYFLAFLGDTFDGYVARIFNQTSKFGGILDMITDRVSTCGFLVILSHLYTDYSFCFVMLIALDIGSHWFHVNSVSSNHKSKEELRDRNILLRTYYEVYLFFVYCIAGTEMFYILLYILHFNPSNVLASYVCWIGCFPACVLKQLINIAQLASAMHVVASADAVTYNRHLE